jgi:hypothetical protein
MNFKPKSPPLRRWRADVFGMPYQVLAGLPDGLFSNQKPHFG